MEELFVEQEGVVGVPFQEREGGEDVVGVPFQERKREEDVDTEISILVSLPLSPMDRISKTAGKNVVEYCLSLRQFRALEMGIGEQCRLGLTRSGCLLSLTKNDWDMLHDPVRIKILSVTKLVQYMGFGYEPPHYIGEKKRTHNGYLERILRHGTTMERIAKMILQKYRGFHDFHFGMSWENGMTMYTCWDLNMTKAITESKSEFVKLGILCEEKSYPLFATPDYVGLSYSPFEEDVLYARVVEIKSPVKSVCLMDIEKGSSTKNLKKLFRDLDLMSSFKTADLKKFMGHVIQTVAYAWLLNKIKMEEYVQAMGGTPWKKEYRVLVEDVAELVYFYPDVAGNRYMFISYEIYWRELFEDDEEDGNDVSSGSPKWHIEDIIQEYYEQYLPLVNRQQRKSLRNGAYPLSKRTQSFDLTEEELQKIPNTQHDSYRDLLFRGIKRARVRVVGGENTKEITSCVLDLFLREQQEKTP